MKANCVLCILHSLGLNMCIRWLLGSSQLQRAWRAASLKHLPYGHQGTRRWRHSGGSTYRAVIFDMGGVLIPSPGKMAAGELLILFDLWSLEIWGVEKRVMRGDQEEHLGSTVTHRLLFLLLN